MGAATSYGGLEIPLQNPEAGDHLPLQLEVVDENVSVVLGRIAEGKCEPFDRINIFDGRPLDISWMAFGWQKATGDYCGSESQCWSWDFASEETAQVIAEWRSLEISEDRKKNPVPPWVLDCVSKLLEYLHDKSVIPATVCIAHHFICNKGDFCVTKDGMPVPIYDKGQFEQLGSEIIQQSRQLMLWFGGKVELPRFDGRLLMENVRRQDCLVQGFKKPGTITDTNNNKLTAEYYGMIDAWRKQGKPADVKVFFDSPDIMGAYRLDFFTLDKFEDEDLLGDPRGFKATYQAFTDLEFKLMLIFVREKDPLSGTDSVSVYKMDLRYDKTEQRLEAKTKHAVSISIDGSSRWVLSNCMMQTWYPGYCTYIQGASSERYTMVLDLLAWHEHGSGRLPDRLPDRRMTLFRVVSLPEQIQEGISFPGRAVFVNGAWSHIRDRAQNS